ncbi:hypothetical protein ALC53_13366 [Atta colombica]|uniref:Uncharacterized protein n=1 Tax=Atta colombica TaxID=520822 RepID=A0A195AWJ6_9HYME|nr:hypothetical protein ALC53_13366 [Atta colombica]
MLQRSRSIIRRDYMARLTMQMCYPFCELSCVWYSSRKKYIVHIVWQQYKCLFPNYASLFVTHIMNLIENYPTNFTHYLCKIVEKQSPKYEIFTQPRQFYQPTYVQRQELTDCFQCIKLLPFEMDPSHHIAEHMFVILLLRQFRNFAPHVQEDNVLDSSKYPSLLLLYSFREGYQIRLEHFAWRSTNRSEWLNPISNPSFYHICAMDLLERFPNNDYIVSDVIVNMSYNSNILSQVVLLAAIIPIQCSRNNCFLKEEANLPQGKVIARNAVPLGPPTSPSKPGNNGIMTNILNTVPSLCALRILFNNVSPI